MIDTEKRREEQQEYEKERKLALHRAQIEKDMKTFESDKEAFEGWLDFLQEQR